MAVYCLTVIVFFTFKMKKNKVIIGSLTFTLVDKKLYVCAYQGCVFLNNVLSLLKKKDISKSI